MVVKDSPKDRGAQAAELELLYKEKYSKSNGFPVNESPAQQVDRTSDLYYTIEECPPWYTSLIFGFQHYVTLFGGTISIPLLLAEPLCMGNDEVAKSELIGTVFFMVGIGTLLQTVFGTRLPIVQGCSVAFIIPTFAILSLPKWKCPGPRNVVSGPLTNVSSNLMATQKLMASNQSFLNANETNQVLLSPTEVWQSRIREVQGAIIGASMIQIVFGFSGIMGFILQFIGPIVITPTISLVGLSLFVPAAEMASKQWWIAISTVILITIFSQYMRNISIPCLKYVKGQGCTRTSGFSLFTQLPLLLSILIIWLICFVLTITDVLPNEPDSWGYGARTDTRLSVITQSSWFRVPYPGQWGMPTFSAAAVVGMVSGVLSSMVESVGDYYACARLSGAPPPPKHAINRGIGIEGLASLLAGIVGTGNAMTSYSENIGTIGITKVGSRRVVQTGALVSLIFGILGKFGALFVTIPDPVIGGMFLIMFGMITAVGLSNLQYVDMNSTRNIFIVGVSIFSGLTLPHWLNTYPGAINTGAPIVDQIFTVLLSTSMFVGGFLAFFLDNTIPGTLAERGLDKWCNESSETGDTEIDNEGNSSTYDFPLGMNLVRKHRWTRYVPFCPTYGVETNDEQLKVIGDDRDEIRRSSVVTV
ncbi:solute carrier family 23 member 1-like [Tubulanus polymorphus]|uniref:solute carrier family 23 member 1-like n=1 Tax=Tubulanus polymorphus TaxID=672921 RepID=UPI003DA30B25